MLPTGPCRSQGQGERWTPASSPLDLWDHGARVPLWWAIGPASPPCSASPTRVSRGEEYRYGTPLADVLPPLSDLGLALRTIDTVAPIQHAIDVQTRTTMSASVTEGRRQVILRQIRRCSQQYGPESPATLIWQEELRRFDRDQDQPRAEPENGTVRRVSMSRRSN